MRLLGTWAIFCALAALSGCAAGIVGSADADSTLRLLSESVSPTSPVVESADDGPVQTIGWRITVGGDEEVSDEPSAEPCSTDHETAAPQEDELRQQADPPLDRQPLAVDVLPDSELPDDALPDEGPSPSDAPTYQAVVASDDSADEPGTMPATVVPANVPQDDVVQCEPVLIETSQPAAPDAEAITTPGPVPLSPFKSATGEADDDRMAREVTDVPIDIRPTEGEMPVNLAAAKFGADPTIDETWLADAPADIFCSYTPWTICYRPLYYEDIKLERYGENVGYLQTGLSGVRFFTTIAAMPYKMTIRRPRSCQCSNGFSRCGDCPLPGYGRREFRLDASLIEAAAVAGVVYILP